MYKYRIGIDIGLKGGISIVSNKDVVSYKMPVAGKMLDILRIKEILSSYTDAHVTFELLNVIFGTSKRTAFSMGLQCGIIEGLCCSLSIPYAKVHPRVWQKEMFAGIPEVLKNGKRDTKQMAYLASMQIFPKALKTFNKAIHDGIVDAMLIAEYAKRKL